MKKILFSLMTLSLTLLNINAQYKKDGTPDMRYNANKNAYSTPTNSYNTNTSVRYQDSYVNGNGTVVESHYKTNSNNTNTDNFSTKDNYNPYNGNTGTKAADYTPDASNYGNGQTIETGPKGGQYYINDNGNKVYVPKR